jgi:hypothetical protein
VVRKSLIALVAFAAGCSGGGKLVEKPPTTRQNDPPEADTPVQLPDAEKIDKPVLTTSAANATVDLKIDFEKRRKATYVLTNESVTQTRGLENGPMLTTKSFLNARQEVSVLDSGAVRIHTSDVKGGVYGGDVAEEAADAIMKGMAASIEGSVLQGEFDPRGRGREMVLLGDGVGLNPMGPQAGTQEVMVGFMGILFPEKPAKVGDKWKGTYDITESAQDLFASSGGMVDNGQVPMTYELLEFNAEKNFIKLRISSAGKPIVKIPMGGALARINMDVKSVGQALVRLDDGWLQELRIETTVITEGYVATKIVTKTITRREK